MSTDSMEGQKNVHTQKQKLYNSRQTSMLEFRSHLKHLLFFFFFFFCVNKCSNEATGTKQKIY